VPTLPWMPTSEVATGSDVVVMASHFRSSSLARVPRFLADAFRVRRQVLGASGALGVSLVAHPLRGEFYTLSAWRDRAAITEFVRTEPHRATMARHHDAMADSTFVFYDLAADALPPSWSEARTRLQR
jgi:heme-degrading monooxygenase HmoA